MRLVNISKQSKQVHRGDAVLLASADTLLALELQRVLNAQGLWVQTAVDTVTALAAIETLEEAAAILLDIRLDGAARLLAAMHESGIHRRCPIAAVAEQVSDEWSARLREGLIDNIVPRIADAAAWKQHLSTMEQGHRLLCELEELRAASLKELRHDRLTGVFNRETMLKLLFRETDRVQRLRGALCLVLLDIDDFANWNEKLGREACDGLLREVSARVALLLRSYDLLGRTGADEFLLALPGCGTVNASMLAERLQIEVFGEPFAAIVGAETAVSVRVTASFGIAASRGRSPVVVLREAEQTLALARQAGPDTIRCSEEGESGSLQLVSEGGALV
jgi:two-component system, cell cycle response regulator